jgi:hypothetical protein
VSPQKKVKIITQLTIHFGPPAPIVCSTATLLPAAGGRRREKGEDRRNTLLAPHFLCRSSAEAPCSQQGWDKAKKREAPEQRKLHAEACACVRTQTRPHMIVSAQACARDLAVSVSVCCEVLVSFSAWCYHAEKLTPGRQYNNSAKLNRTSQQTTSNVAASILQHQRIVAASTLRMSQKSPHRW